MFRLIIRNAVSLQKHLVCKLARMSLAAITLQKIKTMYLDEAPLTEQLYRFVSGSSLGAFGLRVRQVEERDLFSLNVYWPLKSFVAIARSSFKVLLMAFLFSTSVRAETAMTEQLPVDIKIEQPLASVRISYVKDPKEKEKVIRDFQLGLRKYGSAQIVSCDPVVSVSSIETNGYILKGRGMSYAGACLVNSKGHQLSLLMCDFPMVGKFTVTSWGDSDLNWFAQFIRTNCPAGG